MSWELRAPFPRTEVSWQNILLGAPDPALNTRKSAKPPSQCPPKTPAQGSLPVAKAAQLTFVITASQALSILLPPSSVS